MLQHNAAASRSMRRPWRDMLKHNLPRYGAAVLAAARSSPRRVENCGMFFSWLKNQRRKTLLAEPLPWAWHDWLRGNVRHYRHLPPQKQGMMQQVVRVFVAEKTWVGGGGFAVTDKMKAAVAGQAALLALGMDEPYYFDRAQSIILYEGPYEHPARYQRGLGTIAEKVPVYGEAWYRGPIVLSWREVLASGRGASDGRNVVLHEFAHYIDGLDGEVDGSPPLAGREQRQMWYRVTEAEYRRLVGQARRDEISLLDHYGASNRAEFFAVSCFVASRESLAQTTTFVSRKVVHPLCRAREGLCDRIDTRGRPDRGPGWPVGRTPRQPLLDRAGR